MVCVHDDIPMGVWEFIRCLGLVFIWQKKEEGGINGIDRVWGKRRGERKESKSIVDVYLVTSQY